MSATLIDGKALAEERYAAVRASVGALAGRGVRPGLAAVQFGDDPASRIYVRNKLRACEACGVQSVLRRFAATCPEAEALDIIRALNADPAIHGILVQLPLPPQIAAERITQSIAPEKDVDGFHWNNLGALIAGRARFEPCTPRGILALVDYARVAVEGARAVVVGRSNIVGKPVALMLVNRGATVTVCHTRTADLSCHTRDADILIAAAGKAGLITAPMVKRGACVIDVGINRTGDGKLAGDVDFAAVREVAGHITPVPGGVGPMTVAMLIENTVAAAERTARPAAQQ